MAHVFISYHRSDADFAFAAQQELESAGFTAELNPLPDAGTVWYPWIEAALRELVRPGRGDVTHRPHGGGDHV